MFLDTHYSFSFKAEHEISFCSLKLYLYNHTIYSPVASSEFRFGRKTFSKILLNDNFIKILKNLYKIRTKI